MTTPSSEPKFVTLPEIRRAAHARLPREAWNFGAGGSETETTMRRNRRGLDRLAIRQNVLVDVRKIDLSTTLLGHRLSWPVSVAPMGGLVLFHPEGDREMARGAARRDGGRAEPAGPRPQFPAAAHVGRRRLADEDDEAAGGTQGDHDAARCQARVGDGRAIHLGVEPWWPSARSDAGHDRRAAA